MPGRTTLRPALMAAALGGALATGAPVTASAQDTAAPASATDPQTEAVVAATQAFLATLDEAGRKRVTFAFAPQATATATAAEFHSGGPVTFVGEQYGEAMWSNFPTSDVPRPGLPLGEMTEAQREAALGVLGALLSPEGYQKVLDIMESDQVLSESGTRYDDGVAFYTLGVFGTPSATEPWMLQFGGHHLGITAVLQGSDVSITPTLTGAQPAAFEREGEAVRPLGDENDLAFELINALDPAQQGTAILDYEVADLVLGPGRDGMVLQPEGLAAEEMTAEQRTLLLRLVAEWVGMLNEDDARPKMERIEAELDETYFAWSGPTTSGSPVYFRVTGPSLHIEFAHQGGRDGGRPGDRPAAQEGGSNHVHTVYRDPTNAYGAVVASVQ